VNTAEAGHPASCLPARCSDTDDGACPGCGVTHGVQPTAAPPKVDAARCTECGLHWACTVIGVFPTPQLRTAAFLTVLRVDVTRLSGKDPAP
jgi:hypothetical protein